MDKREMILDGLKTLNNDSAVELWNEYCSECNCPDDTIFDNGESFFEEHFEGRVTEAVQAALAGDYNFSHDYVRFNGYANLESFNCADDDNSPVDFDSLADYLIENKDDDEIAELLDIEFEEETEEDEETERE